MKVGSIAGVILVLVSLSLPGIAADNPKVAWEAKDMPIEQAMAELAKEAGVQIVCDSDVKGSVTGHFDSIELEKLLDAVTKSNSLKWQKLYLPGQDEQKPTVAQIKARAEAVAAVSGGSIIVYDAATGKQKVFIEQESATPSVTPDKLGLKPIYLVLKPKTEAKSSGQDKQGSTEVAKRYQALEEERTQLLAKMTPEQRIAAMQQEMLSMMNLDPASRQQMMLAEMKARESMDPQMRDSYRQMMRDTFRAMHDQGLIPSDHGGRRDQGQGPPPPGQ